MTDVFLQGVEAQLDSAAAHLYTDPALALTDAFRAANRQLSTLEAARH